MALTTRFRLEVLAGLTGTADLSTPQDDLRYVKELALPSGVGAGQADKLWRDGGRSIAASSTDSLDLAGSLTDAFGQALTFAKLKAIVVVAAATNTNNVVITRPASNGVPIFSAAGDALPVPPGGFAAWVAPGAGVTVTAGTGDLIDLVNSGAGTPVVCDVILVGTSA